MYWFFRRPTTAGVRCIIVHDNEILLIKHSYGSALKTTVGGGIKSGETLKQAVLREVCEEVGIILDKTTEIGTVLHEKEFKHDTIHVFFARVSSKNLDVRDGEILEAAWYSIDRLPDDISPLFKEFFTLAKPYF